MHIKLLFLGIIKSEFVFLALNIFPREDFFCVILELCDIIGNGPYQGVLKCPGRRYRILLSFYRCIQSYEDLLWDILGIQ